MTIAKEWAVNQLPVPGIHARLNHYSGLRGAVKLGSRRAVPDELTQVKKD
jgi:hypothetical protein